ncbi:hypothetical protein L1286_13005 [Pseudoalteromonas sp. SMS1]|uniref:hypothetical protein n=1 Tax=Pseudoalteromonas sp. SMS1 TaxID=2908894 RepID=UPI001F31BB35|nr:hypothetical protein [Pseudoalteromonas sp. SMS1]MCF2858400.1 hypothetical protein [Pseudoalteromonas sp. SMS1]
MSDSKKMTNEEFSQMVTLLSKFANTDMDQFENWKFECEFGEVFVSLSLDVQGDKSVYTDVTRAIKK